MNTYLNIMKLRLLFGTLALGILPNVALHAQDDDRIFKDGYDHSLQDYITRKIESYKLRKATRETTPVTEVASAEAVESNIAASTTADTVKAKKKWKREDYVTIPKFGGYIITHYKYDSREGANGGEGFNLRLLRLYVDGTVFRDFNYRVQMEVSGNPAGSEQSGASARVIDAFINWSHWKELGIKLGEFKRNFTMENPSNPWDIGGGDYSLIVKHIAGMGASQDLNGDPHNSGGRDLGIQVHGSLFPSKKDGHRYLSYQFGVFNGQGINSGDKDSKKDIIGALTVEPLKGLKIAGFGWRGSYFNTTYGLGESYARWAASVSYEKKDWLFRTEYARHIGSTWNNTEKAYTGPDHADGWYALACIPVWRWIRLNLKYDAFRTNMRDMNSLRSIYSVCAELRPHKNLMLQLQYNHDYDKTRVAKASNQFWAMAYIRF